ncbi:MAG: branched-chain amino acid ABC transporter permease [Thermodesulfobacteriota bacterium]
MVRWKKPALAGAIILFSVALPTLIKRTDVINGLFLILLFITLSQSWNILAGFAGQINLGHAGFFGLGALTMRTLWLAGLPFIPAFLLGGLTSSIFALLIGFPAFRLRGAYFVVGMLAMAEIMRITVGNALPQISALPSELIASYRINHRYYMSLMLAAATMVIAYTLSRSKQGLAMLAVKQDQDTSEATGVNTFKFKLFALSLSALLAGLAGGVFAFFHVSYYPAHAFSPQWTFDSLFIAYIGGIGTVAGPVIGALFYVALRELFSLILPLQIHTIIFGILFILVIFFMPRGLIEIPQKLKRILSYFGFQREFSKGP